MRVVIAEDATHLREGPVRLLSVAEALVVSESAVAKHVNAAFTRLDMPQTESPHRRIVAVLQFLAASKGARS